MSAEPGEILPPGAATTVVLLCRDLLLSSHVSGAVAARGGVFRSAAHAGEALAAVHEALAAGKPCRLFVDLTVPDLELGELVRQLPAAVLQQAVACGPHVHEALLQAARAAGFGQVLSRGAFHARVSQLI